MSGIKSTVFVVGIVGAAVTLYFRSSLSTNEATALKASPPAVEEKTPEPGPPAAASEPDAMPVVAMLPQVVDQPQVAALPKAEPADETKGPNAAAIKKIQGIHAKQRHMAREVLRRCRDGKEKRPQICQHARQVMWSSPRPPKKTAEK